MANNFVTLAEVKVNFNELNYYQILGLNNRDATTDEIKKAYRKLAMQVHPDKLAENQNNELPTMQDIVAAYETLVDSNKPKHVWR